MQNHSAPTSAPTSEAHLTSDKPANGNGLLHHGHHGQEHQQQQQYQQQQMASSGTGYNQNHKSGFMGSAPSFKQWIKLYGVDLLTMAALGAVGLGVSDWSTSRWVPRISGHSAESDAADNVRPRFYRSTRRTLLPLVASPSTSRTARVSGRATKARLDELTPRRSQSSTLSSPTLFATRSCVVSTIVQRERYTDYLTTDPHLGRRFDCL